jgi:hypothetical protein
MSEPTEFKTNRALLVAILLLCYPLLMFRLLNGAYSECKTRAEYIGSTIFTGLGLVAWFSVLWLAIWIVRVIT